MPARALTVRQPWAALIVAGIKDVENRTWRTSHTGLIAIHASAAYDDAQINAALRRFPDLAFRFGAIIGHATLTGCVRDSPSEWAEPGRWHWLLAGARPCAVVPARGWPGLWSL